MWSGSKVHAILLALLSVLRLPHEHLFCPLFLSLRRMVLQSLAPFSYRFSFFLCSLMCFAILMPRGKVPHSCSVGTFRQGRRCHGLAVPPPCCAADIRQVSHVTHRRGKDAY